MNREKLKKEMSLIDSLIIHSRTVLALKIARKEQRKTLFLISRLPINITASEKIKEIIEELTYSLDQFEIVISRLLKKALKGQRIIVPNKFHFSGSDLKSGYCCLEQIITQNDGKLIKVCKYLLLTDVSHDIIQYKIGTLLDEKQLIIIESSIPSVLGNMEALYKITMNNKCSIVEST